MAKLTPEEELAKLRAEILRLEGALKDSEASKDDAVKRAMFFTPTEDERATGKTVKVMRATNPTAKDEDDQGWKEFELPTYYYKVDMPPVGGIDIKIDGISIQHGQVYEFTLDGLRLIKSIVYNLQCHEASIHGSDENAYRPKTNAHFSGKAQGRVQ